MPSQGVTNVANAIINKINNLISSHNSNSNAHQDIRESIPSATSELNNNSGFITSSSVPSASSATPSADTTNGSVGTGTTWARSDHRHPKSSLYAEASHTHTKSQITDFPTFFDGDYNNLTNKPSIPSNTSDLNNDSGFITSNGIINNDSFCDYKTLIPLVDENKNIFDISFEDYDFDIIFTINPNIEDNDCQGSIEIGDPAVGGVFVQYLNQEIQIQTQSGDEFNTALNMTSENTVKIKQDKLTNDLTITVNNHEFISTDNSEITKNIIEIRTSVGTISSFRVKTCTRIITEATIDELIKYGEERL